mmetsp:Transcript_70181/g.180904  ORF Transcript_70181/g.180904 Transcript_70181/m.180904 type:complete len:200 (-) Transcript_70181:335-934(-)
MASSPANHCTAGGVTYVSTRGMETPLTKQPKQMASRTHCTQSMVLKFPPMNCDRISVVSWRGNDFGASNSSGELALFLDHSCQSLLHIKKQSVPTRSSTPRRNSWMPGLFQTTSSPCSFGESQWKSRKRRCPCTRRAMDAAPWLSGAHVASVSSRCRSQSQAQDTARTSRAMPAMVQGLPSSEDRLVAKRMPAMDVAKP